MSFLRGDQIAKMSVRMRKYFTRPDGNHDVNIYILYLI